MKPTTKKIVISALVVLAFVAVWGFNKAKTLMAIFEKITIDPSRISKVDVSLNRIKFNIDVLLTNPTQEDFNVSGFGIATVKSVSIFYDGVYIATSNVDLSEISLPAINKIILHDIVVEVPQPLDFVANNLVLISNMFQDFKKLNIDKITTTATIQVAGQTIEI